MILRRITEHFRKQEWTAIFLDFIIVVLGVFVGMQVSNWNAAQAAARQERVYLARLRDEIRANNETLQFRIDYVETVLAAGERVDAFLNGDAPCTDDCRSMLVDFFISTQVWGTAVARPIYHEMERQGLPSSPSIKTAIDAYYKSFDGLILDALPAYREAVRTRIPAKVAATLWRDCWSVTGGEREFLHPECAETLGDIDAVAIVERLRTTPDLPDMLNFWMQQSVYFLRTQPGLLADGEAAKSAIAAELNKGG